MYKIVVFSLIALVGVSCNSVNEKKEYVSAVVADELSEKELKESMKDFEAEEARRLEEERKNTTSLEFEKVFHDFGTVKPASENTYKFKVKNTGKVPLVIESVEASCGCTTPHKPEKPIPPGGTDYIEVGFKSKEGQVNEITKTVTVTANTNPKITELQIRAFVKG